MASPYAAQLNHMDDFGGRHYPPQAQAPPPASTQRPRRPRYEGAPEKYERRPRRAHSYRPPPPPSSSTSSASPPQRHATRRSPRNHPLSPSAEDYYAPRHRRQREADYFSDNRYDRRHPPRDSHRDRDAPTKINDDAERPERKERKWQKEGKKLFQEYAVPAIKAEGTKYLSKQIGNLLAKKVGS